MFNLFKKKKQNDDKINNDAFDIASLFSHEMTEISHLKKGFLWGFTQGDPMKHSNSTQEFYKLINLVSGQNGTVTIGASFHPYQLINDKNEDLWEQLFNVIKANKFCDLGEIIREKHFFHMNPPSKEYFKINVWNDERLLTDYNPEFGTYVPVIIPYLTFENGKEPFWLTQINEEVKKSGNAHNYLDKINNGSKFLLPEPTFIVGFGEFDKNNLKGTVDNFVNFLNNSINKK
jgi:hypothetical protein